MNLARKYFLIFVLITAVLLASCVRPTPRAENPDIDQTQPTTELPVVTDPPAQEEQAVVDPNAEQQPPAETGDGTAAEQPSVAGDETQPADPATETPADTTIDDNTETNAGETTDDTDEGEGQPSAEVDPSPTVDIPATEHVVQAGENLYRIGLKYSKSYIQIAQANNIPAPYTISVGQKLTIPGSETATPSVGEETTYVVEPGDTLFSIGLAKGISWIQIAEANGLSNPNRIAVGDTLKIPVSTPGPTPQFTHTVRPAETLYAIAIQYGISWTAIAAENNISSPYVIFAGTTLSIPGN